MNKIDFIHVCHRSGNKWRIKSATSIDEFLAALNLRYKVYLEQSYTTLEEIQTRRNYGMLLEHLRDIDVDPYNGQYDIDAYDRFDEYVKNNFDGTNIHTELIVALEELNEGSINIDGKAYQLAGAVRVVRDDTNLTMNPLDSQSKEQLILTISKYPTLKKVVGFVRLVDW